MDALAGGLASVVIEGYAGLVESIDEDCLTDILLKVAGAPKLSKSSTFKVTTTSAPMLWRIARTCVVFRDISAVLAPPPLAPQAKLLAMHSVLMPAIVATTHLWPVAHLLEMDRVVSKMDIVRYITDRADVMWCEAGPYKRVLSGGTDAIEKRVRKKRSNVSRADLVAAYSAFVETTVLDTEGTFRQAGFMHRSSARLLARATMHALIKHAIEERLDANLDERIHHVKGMMAIAKRLDPTISEEEEQNSLCDAGFDFCIEYIEKARARGNGWTKWPSGAFKFLLTRLKRHGLVTSLENYRNWRSLTVNAANPRLAFQLDASKGTHWLAVPANAARAKETLERNLEFVNLEIPQVF